GQEIELHELKRQVSAVSESGSKQTRVEGRPNALHETGTVSVPYDEVLGLLSMGHARWSVACKRASDSAPAKSWVAARGPGARPRVCLPRLPLWSTTATPTMWSGPSCASATAARRRCFRSTQPALRQVAG